MSHHGPAIVLTLCGVMACGWTARAASGEDAAQRYGERLAQECFTCHTRDGRDTGIPGIIAMSDTDIVNALTLYKTGLRPNKVMVSVATSLDADQIKAVARYLSSLGQGARPAAK